MDWDDLRYVLAIHREKTLSGAAAALGVTRTTVGRRLKEAESRLRVRLFDRTDEGFVATAAGDDLADTAVRLEAEIQVTEGRLLGRDAELLHYAKQDPVLSNWRRARLAWPNATPDVVRRCSDCWQ